MSSTCSQLRFFGHFDQSNCERQSHVIVIASTKGEPLVFALLRPACPSGPTDGGRAALHANSEP